MTTLKSRNVALLTGAGFTKSFGGYLASEMWAKIFNHPQIQGNESIRRCMLRHVNFEHAYAAVMDSENYSETEKKAFTEAVRTAFRNMHGNIIDRAFDEVAEIFDVFISLFGGNEIERGLLFTLNQDLLMEVGFAHSESQTSDFDILGLPKEAWFLESVLRDIETNPILLPDRDSVEKIKSNSSKIVLYPSYI